MPCPVACDLRVYGNGLSSGVSLASHCDSGSFLVVQAAKMDSSEDSGRLVGHMDWCHLSSFDLS